MANCNCNDFPISCAPHAPGGDCHHHHGCPPHPVCPPPEYKGGTSMYIGARYVPIFADPVEWDDEREYEPLTIVIHEGNMYTSKCYVPKGAPLPEYPETQTKYWVCTANYNYQFADLKKTVLDLSRLVEQFQKNNETFTELINTWNEKVQQWEKDMAAWQETMDDFNTRVEAVEKGISDLTAALNEEITRAKAREDALEADYKAADAKEATTRADADNALQEQITANDADIKALQDKDVEQDNALQQEIDRATAAENANTAAITEEAARAKAREDALESDYKAADAEETAARVDADTKLDARVTANKNDIDAIKAEQVIQNTNISANAKNIADNAAELAKHAERLTDLEGNVGAWDSVYPDTTITEEMQKEALARSTAVTEINGRLDSQAADIEEVRDLANHKVDQTTYDAGQAAQDARLDALESGKADKTDLKDWVLTTTYEEGQAAQNTAIEAAQDAADEANGKADANATNIGAWTENHPDKTISQAVADLENAPGPDLSGYVPYGDHLGAKAIDASKVFYANDPNAAQETSLLFGDKDGQFFRGASNYLVKSSEYQTDKQAQVTRDLAQDAKIEALEGTVGDLGDTYVLKSDYDAAVGNVATSTKSSKPLADIVGSTEYLKDGTVYNTMGPWNVNFPNTTIANACMGYKSAISDFGPRITALENAGSGYTLPDSIQVRIPAPVVTVAPSGSAMSLTEVRAHFYAPNPYHSVFVTASYSSSHLPTQYNIMYASGSNFISAAAYNNPTIVIDRTDADYIHIIASYVPSIGSITIPINTIALCSPATSTATDESYLLVTVKKPT